MPRLNTSEAPGAASPLWIIALFIALSEVTAGIAAITTDGTARLIFACFAVAFPTLVFGIFVWLLINYAPNLYAPGQYSADITPEIYRMGIRRDEQIIIGKALAGSIPSLLAEAGIKIDERKATEQVARDFEETIKAQSVSVILDELKPGADELQIPVTEETSVNEFLNRIYLGLHPAVKVYTYGKSWILEDFDGKVYSNMGSKWAHDRDLTNDGRPIAEVGISPGQRMKAIAKH